MNYLSICAIVRNEGLYIEEWLKYHANLGVEAFYLYDNCSDDDTVQRAIDSKVGTVSFQVLPGVRKQLEAYNDCLRAHFKDCMWIAFIDVDEFLVPHQHKDLRQLLMNYEKYPALAAHWYLFGSNGHLTYSAEPVVERFTRRQADVNRHVKTICNPRRTFNAHNPHVFEHDSSPVDEHFKEIGHLNALPEHGTCDVIQINHYATKSLEECRIRRLLPRIDTGEVRNVEEFFKGHDCNDVEDLCASRLYGAVNV